MPEGHSIHRIAARFDSLMVGERITVSSPQGRFAQGAGLLDSREMERCYAVGKQMFTEFSGELTLRVHLGLYGAWDFWDNAAEAASCAVSVSSGGPAGSSMGAPRRARVEGIRAGESEAVLATAGAAPEGGDREEAQWPPPPVGAVRARLLTASACADLRGPTVCEVLSPAEVASRLRRLGPDPLVDGQQEGRHRFLDRASRRRTAIGALLMDQAVIAGIGNIYRAEILFRAGVNPYTPAARLGADALSALWDDWCGLLRTGVETGVILTRTELRGGARRRALDREDERHFVYGRAGQPCRECGTPVRIALMQARKLYWCAICQPA